MKKYRWHVTLGLSLVTVSAVVYAVQIIVFRKPGDTFFYMLQDFAFVPVQVLLVTLIINEMLTVRERSALQKKMNMAIGAFFSEVGTRLLKALAEFDPRAADMTDVVVVRADWPASKFAAARRFLHRHEPEIEAERGDLAWLKSLLGSKREFMLALLANPNLLEHQSFTDLLWAVFHLAEELDYRPRLDGLPETDYAHLAGDIKRAYVRLVGEWIGYMRHLKDEYPYIFSIAIRTNPLDPDASITVTAR